MALTDPQAVTLLSSMALMQEGCNLDIGVEVSDAQTSQCLTLFLMPTYPDEELSATSSAPCLPV